MVVDCLECGFWFPEWTCSFNFAELQNVQKMTQFAIVEFVLEKAVDVVPETWIETRDGVLYCYYPRSNVAFRVRKKEMPDKERWTSYKIRILSYADKYEKAMKRAKQAEETSNIDSSESESEGMDKRPRKRIDYAESGGYDDENSQPRSKRQKKTLQDITKSTGDVENIDPRRRPLQKKSNASNNLNLMLPMAPHFSENLSAELARIPTAPNSQLHCQPISEHHGTPRVDGFRSAELVGESLRVLDSHMHGSSIPNTSDPFLTSFDGDDPFSSIVHDLGTLRELDHSSSPVITSQSGSHQMFQTRVLMKLDSIIDNQKDILIHLRRQSTATGGTGDVVLEDVLPKPLETLEEIGAFCTKLEQLAFNKALVNYLAAQSGHTCSDTVRRIMSKVGTNKLWSLYSFKGRKGKKSFKSLNLYNIIIKACMKCHQKVNELKIEEYISDTLKHAPGRPGGSRHQILEV